YQGEVDDILISRTIPVGCGRVQEKLEPRFRANPQDVGLAKQTFRQMLIGKCTDDPLCLEAGDVDVNAEPALPSRKNVGIRHLAPDNVAKAEDMFKKALDVATEKSDKGDIQMLLGTVEARKNNNAGAREWYRKAIATDGRKEAYEKIGDLYFNSAAACR